MIINISSSRPGLGKSTLMLTLAGILSLAGQKVLVLSDRLHLDERLLSQARLERVSSRLTGELEDIGFSTQQVFDGCWVRLASQGPWADSDKIKPLLLKMADQGWHIICSGAEALPARHLHMVAPDLKRAKEMVSSPFFSSVDEFLVSFMAAENCCKEMEEAFATVVGKTCHLLPLDGSLQCQDLRCLSLDDRQSSGYGKRVYQVFSGLLPNQVVKERLGIYQVFKRLTGGVHDR